MIDTLIAAAYKTPFNLLFALIIAIIVITLIWGGKDTSKTKNNKNN